MEEIDELRARVAHLETTRVAFMLVLVALMRHQPDQLPLQLFLTRLLEQQVTGGALGNTLQPAQRDDVRETVEWIQTMAKK